MIFLLFTLLSFSTSLTGLFVFFRNFAIVTRIAPFMFLIVLGILLVTYNEMVSKRIDELLEKMRKRKYIHKEDDEELYKIDNESPELYVLVKNARSNKKEYRAFHISPGESSSSASAYYTSSSMLSKGLDKLGIDPSKSSLIVLEHKDELYTTYLFSHEYAHRWLWEKLYASISEQLKKLRSRLSELNNKFNELSKRFYSQLNENAREKIRSLSRLIYYVDREIELLKAGTVPSSLREYHEEHSMITSILVLLQYLKEDKLKRDKVTTIIQKMIETYTSSEIEPSYTYAIKDLFGNFSEEDPIWNSTRKLMYAPYDDEKTMGIVNYLISRLEGKRIEVIEKAEAEIQKGVSETEAKLNMIERELYELIKQK
jgi:hypothetical protein